MNGDAEEEREVSQQEVTPLIREEEKMDIDEGSKHQQQEEE